MRRTYWEPQVGYERPSGRGHWLVTLYWTDGSKIRQYVTVPEDDRTSFPPSEIVGHAIEAHGISDEHLIKSTQEWRDR